MEAMVFFLLFAIGIYVQIRYNARPIHWLSTQLGSGLLVYGLLSLIATFGILPIKEEIAALLEQEIIKHSAFVLCGTTILFLTWRDTQFLPPKQSSRF